MRVSGEGASILLVEEHRGDNNDLVALDPAILLRRQHGHVGVEVLVPRIPVVTVHLDYSTLDLLRVKLLRDVCGHHGTLGADFERGVVDLRARDLRERIPALLGMRALLRWIAGIRDRQPTTLALLKGVLHTRSTPMRNRGDCRNAVLEAGESA